MKKGYYINVSVKDPDTEGKVLMDILRAARQVIPSLDWDLDWDELPEDDEPLEYCLECGFEKSIHNPSDGHEFRLADSPPT